MSGYDGYDSGYSDDRYAEAERLRQSDESRKIVIALWPEQMQSNLQGQSPGCEFCPGRILVVSKKDVNAHICPECGNLTPSPRLQRNTNLDSNQSRTVSLRLSLHHRNANQEEKLR